MPQLSSLTLNLEGCTQVSDTGLKKVAEVLPRSLRELELSLHGCRLVTEVGMSQLAESLPPFVERLAMDLCGAPPLRLLSKPLAELQEDMEESTSTLAASHPVIPPTVMELNLNLRQCRDLTNETIRDLATNLPPVLVKFSLGLRQCPVADGSVMALAMSAPAGLRELTLAFELCPTLTDAALAAGHGVAVFQALPPTLELLDLSFEGCKNFTDTGVRALGSSLPPQLKVLKLSLRQCFRITDASLSGLAVPRTVTQLRVDLWGCWQLTDRGIARMVEGWPLGVTSLDLVVSRCVELTELALKVVGTWGRACTLSHLAVGCEGCPKIPGRGWAGKEEVLALAPPDSVSKFEVGTPLLPPPTKLATPVRVTSARTTKPADPLLAKSLRSSQMAFGDGYHPPPIGKGALEDTALLLAAFAPGAGGPGGAAGLGALLARAASHQPRTPRSARRAPALTGVSGLVLARKEGWADAVRTGQDPWRAGQARDQDAMSAFKWLQ
mmetsp:Transcript_47531/g.103469  ORF Transcript_47531/g.103469 Transcript_47531/m.103469 type:complete len:497 (-) Transcript_47531:57-1547(-)